MTLSMGENKPKTSLDALPLVASEGDEILNAHGKFVLLAMCGATEDPHICAAVVRAVNAHADLVRLLQALTRDATDDDVIDVLAYGQAHDEARKLLASLE